MDGKVKLNSNNPENDPYVDRVSIQLAMNKNSIGRKELYSLN